MIQVQQEVTRVIVTENDTRVTVIGGLRGSGGGGGSQNLFIQDTAPIAAGAYLWIDTTGGNLQFFVEDGT